MEILSWSIWQLLSYGPIGIIFFIAASSLPAYKLSVPGIFLGHFIVAAYIVVADLIWIQSEIHKPGWNGTPDQDFVFQMGMFARIISTNIFLLPVACFATWLGKYRKRLAEEPDGAATK